MQPEHFNLTNTIVNLNIVSPTILYNSTIHQNITTFNIVNIYNTPKKKPSTLTQPRQSIDSISPKHFITTVLDIITNITKIKHDIELSSGNRAPPQVQLTRIPL